MKTMISMRIVSKIFDSWLGRKPIAQELRAASMRIRIKGEVNCATKILSGLTFFVLVRQFFPNFFSSWFASVLVNPFTFCLFSILLLV